MNKILFSLCIISFFFCFFFQVTGIAPSQVITTIDPRLAALGLAQYPPLPANLDAHKIEEIRRTVYVGNLDTTVRL